MDTEAMSQTSRRFVEATERATQAALAFQVAWRSVRSPSDASSPAKTAAMEWWWLSFTDSNRAKGSQFLGVVIVQGRGIGRAIMRAHRLGINPGGAVQGVQIPPEHLPDPSFRERLLTRAEAERL